MGTLFSCAVDAGLDGPIEVKALHQGWATKQGQFVQNWKSRFFQLTDQELLYSVMPGGYPKGRIALSRVVSVKSIDGIRVQNVVTCFIDPRHPNCFGIACEFPPRLLYVCTESAAETQTWIDKLSQATKTCKSKGVAPIKEGSLMKLDSTLSVLAQWSWSYVRLYPNEFTCAPSSRDAPKQTINTAKVTSVEPLEVAGKPHCFGVMWQDRRVIYFTAEDATEMCSWLDAFRASTDAKSRPSSTSLTSPRISTARAAPVVQEGPLMHQGADYSWNPTYVCRSSCCVLSSVAGPPVLNPPRFLKYSVRPALSTCNPAPPTTHHAAADMVSRSTDDPVADSWKLSVDQITSVGPVEAEGVSHCLGVVCRDSNVLYFTASDEESR